MQNASNQAEKMAGNALKRVVKSVDVIETRVVKLVRKLRVTVHGSLRAFPHKP